MRLIHKFFLILFATSVIVVVLMTSVLGFGLTAGFKKLIAETENQHLMDVKLALSSLYLRDGGWQRLESDEDLWRSIVNPKGKSQQKHHDRKPPRDKPRDKSGHKPGDGRRPPPDQPLPLVEAQLTPKFMQTGKRIGLYDAKKRAIYGPEPLSSNSVVEPIVIQGKTVGWLGLKSSSENMQDPEQLFLLRQYRLYAIVSLGILIFSFVIAFLWSRQMMRPISRLAAGAKRIREGDYETRIENRSSDELGELAANINELAVTLENNRQSRRRWMSDTSHELRTPLTVIKSQLMAIQDGVMPLDDARIQLLIDEVDGVNRLVDDLYQLSFEDAAEINYQKVLLNPVTILEETLAGFESKFKTQGIALNLDQIQSALTDKAQMLADSGRLKQLFTNLLENTLRYTDSDGALDVAVSKEGQQLVFQFNDSAPGVTDEQLGKLSERFYRGEPSRSRKHGGAGLGLALCAQIVEAHQGSLSFAHSPTGGLSIIIKLPIN